MAASSHQCFPFFVGRGRSGTTLLLAMFDSHSQMAIPYESHFAVRMGLRRRRYERPGHFDLDRFTKDLITSDGLGAWGLSKEAVAATLEETGPSSLGAALRSVYDLYARGNGKARYGEKSPGYVMHIPMLADLFPEARFVHIIRDGRNVALSYRESEWGTKDVAESAYYWERFVARGRQSGLQLGSQRYREVRYEELLEDSEGTVRELCDFLELDFEEDMLRYYERAEAVLDKIQGESFVKAHVNLSRPPTKGLRDWRTQMSDEDVEIFEALAGDLLDDLGYERRVARPSPRIRAAARSRLMRVHARRAGRAVSSAVNPTPRQAITTR